MIDKSKIKKVVLAYSGGLDTSIIIPWLKENYNNPEIIAVSGNVGQADELEGLEEKALKTGASKLYVLDLTKEFVEDFIFPTVKAGAKYEEYLMGTAFARPLIGVKLAEIALQEGADAICHGCTGKGNDQVRFELAIKSVAPNMPIIAPWREWEIKSRDEEIDYAEAHNVPLKITRETNYSKDKNLWHLSHEGLDLEDPANEPQYNKPGFLEMSVSPEQAPDKPTYVTISFEKGNPVAVNGEKMELLEKLEKLSGMYEAQYESKGHYPAWEYKSDSELRDVMVAEYQKMFGAEPSVVSIHAGLECGLLGEKIEGLDAVSIGPEMHDIHTSRERLGIASTARMWEFIKAVLKAL